MKNFTKREGYAVCIGLVIGGLAVLTGFFLGIAVNS